MPTSTSPSTSPASRAMFGPVGDPPVEWGQWLALIDEGLKSWAAGADERGVPPPFHDAMAYSALAPGKRLRPALVLAATAAVGGSVADAVSCACAVELVHAYSLVHDDLPSMDDDDLRRGRPTSHRVYGEATAILVGDALQSEAFRLVAEDDTLADHLRLQLVATIARAAGPAGMAGGQYLDVHPHASVPVQAVHDLKTGALLQAAVECGAIIGRARRRDHELIRTYGTHLGRLFQVVDDVLDATASRDELGKEPGTDSRHARTTAVSQSGIAGASTAADLELDACHAAAKGLADGAALEWIAGYVRHRRA